MDATDRYNLNLDIFNNEMANSPMKRKKSSQRTAYKSRNSHMRTQRKKKLGLIRSAVKASAYSTKSKYRFYHEYLERKKKNEKKIVRTNYKPSSSSSSASLKKNRYILPKYLPSTSYKTSTNESLKYSRSAVDQIFDRVPTHQWHFRASVKPPDSTEYVRTKYKKRENKYRSSEKKVMRTKHSRKSSASSSTSKKHSKTRRKSKKSRYPAVKTTKNYVKNIDEIIASKKHGSNLLNDIERRPQTPVKLVKSNTKTQIDVNIMKSNDILQNRVMNRPLSALKSKLSEKPTEKSDESWVSLIKNLTTEDIHVKDLLGEGAFSKVYLVEFNNTRAVHNIVPDTYRSKPLAMKVIQKETKVSRRRQESNFMWERLALSTLKSDFMVNYYGSFSDSNRLCMLMEFAIGGEILYHFEKARLGRFDNEICKFFIGEIICALQYLHENDFVYRDLKPENILLDANGHIKLVDFGFAKQLKNKQRTYTLCGSIEYVAPEVLTGNGHAHSVDIWSLGVLTYELLVGRLPFPTQGCGPHDVLSVIKSTRVKLPRYVPKSARDFIRRLLVLTPIKRMGCGREGIRELKKHKWFEDFDWILCNNRQLSPPIKPTFKGIDDVSNFANARFDTSAPNDIDSAFDNF